jgi:NitT/TauT family transport system substrate-binding protein
MKRILGAVLLASLLVGSAAAADIVKVGTAGTLNDAPIMIAVEKGFFKEEGLEVDLIPFDSGAKQIASLGIGEIDVGSGAMSAGFYNALARGIGFKIVADKGHMAPGYQFQTLFMRKDLVDSGQFKNFGDLKGKKIAVPAPGVGTLAILNEAAKKGGLQLEDINVVFLGFAQQIAAFQNKSIDGSILIEPAATILAQGGYGVRFANTQDFNPDQQAAVVFYSEKFTKDRPHIAVKFMKSYLRGIRVYNAALKDTRLKGGTDSEWVVDLVSRHFKIKPEVAREIYSQALDPNGEIKVKSLQRDMEFFQEKGLLKETIDLTRVIDMSFVRKAAAELKDGK